jgi:hypothetical protein
MSISPATWPSRLQWNDFVCNSFFETTTFLTFTLSFQSNDLTHHQRYSTRQQVVFELIWYIHETEGLGYRKTPQKLNNWGIKTERNKTWFNTSVYSILKRKNQRQVEYRRWVQVLLCFTFDNIFSQLPGNGA